MRSLILTTAACLVSSTSIAAGNSPTIGDVRQCIQSIDAKALANLADRKRHLCPEYFVLRTAKIKDASVTNGQADVDVSTTYEVLQPVYAFIAKQCISPEPTPPIGTVQPGTILERKSRTLTMKRWSDGWKCAPS